MSVMTPEDEVAALGEALNQCAARAFDAFRENEPEMAAEVFAELVAGIAQTQVLVVSGGKQPASIAVSVLLSDGTLQPLATLSITPLRFN